MASKRDIKRWLKENNYTWEQMDKFWEECCEVNWKCKLLCKNGKSWSDMTMFQIEQLPTLKEKTLEQQAEKERARLAEEEAKRKAEEYNKYYREHFDEIMLKKIDDGEELEEKEISNLVWEYAVQTTKDENRRWTRSVSTVIELGGRFFEILWEEGLTEMQENEFYNQPVEVFPRKQVVISCDTVYATEKQETSGVGQPLVSDALIKKLITMLNGTDMYITSESDDGMVIVTK